MLAIDDFHCSQVLSGNSAALSVSLHNPTRNLVSSHLLLLIRSTANRAGLRASSSSHIIYHQQSWSLLLRFLLLTELVSAQLLSHKPSIVDRAGLHSFASSPQPELVSAYPSSSFHYLDQRSWSLSPHFPHQPLPI